MEEYVVYIIFTVVAVIACALIAPFLYARIGDRNKCINCQYSEICDKGNPETVCHLKNDK